jgi:Na+/melibiose symporter-like transporter
MDGTTSNDDDALRERAVARINARRAFFGNLGSYVVVGAVLWIIWALTDGTSDGGVPWPLWVMGFWGIAVVLHAWSVFGQREVTEGDVTREMERMRQSG